MRKRNEPAESLTEITGAIDGLSEYMRAMEARTAEVEKVLARKPAPRPDPKALATRYRTTATVAVAALIAATVVVALFLWLHYGGAR